MKSLSNYISLPRISHLLKKELYEKRKTLILRSVILIAILSTATLFIGQENSWRYDNIADSINRDINNTYIPDSYELSYDPHIKSHGVPTDRAINDTIIFFMFAFPITMALGASFAFESMASKRKKIAFLMTPATTLEKYITQFVIYTFGIAVLFFVSCFIAELVRYLVFSAIYPGYGIIQMISVDDILDFIRHRPMPIFTYLMGTTLASALFFLGSAIWPRLSFIKTFGVLSAIFFSNLFLGMAIYSFPCIFESALGEEDLIFNFVNSTFIIISIFCFTMAYFRLRESEIIQRM